MTTLREAAQQALESMDDHMYRADTHEFYEAKEALRAALAEPAEPVAWMYHGIRHDGTPHDRPSLIWRPEYMDAMSVDKGAKATPLYTAPTQRKPLTDETLWEMWVESPSDVLRFARAIEAAHGIKGDA